MNDFFVVWVFPPLIGAVIGLFTNWLAIKMLFRPLHELRFLGIRIPFTPGILPRERFRISRSIGDTVAKELLTETVLRRRLKDPAILNGLGASVSSFLSQILGGSAAEMLRASERPAESTTIIGLSLGRAFQRLAGSDAFIAALSASMGKFLETLGTMHLSSVVGLENIDACMNFLLDPASGASGEKMLDLMVERIYGRKSKGIIPSEVFDPLVRIMAESLYVASVPVIESFMEEPSTRKMLETQALDIVRRAVGRLNPLQRIMATAANYERTAAEAMPATIDDLARSLSSVLRRDEMRGVMASKAASFLSRGTSGEGGSLDFSSILPKQAARKALAATLSALRESRIPLTRRLEAVYAERGDMSLADLVGDLGIPVERIVASLASSISTSLASPREGNDVARTIFSTFRSALISRFGDATIGDVLGIDAGTLERLSAAIAEKALDLICQEAGNIIAGLDIRKIVVERIDELDIKEVERMILDVVNSELVWITIIGGVLGALIGIIQSLIYALGR